MGTIKVFIKGVISNLVFTALLFVCAGRPDYWQGWVFLGANLVASVMNYLTIRKKPELALERAKMGVGVKRWDQALLGLSAVVYLFMLVVAGLDSGRYLWTNAFRWSISISGLGLLIIGQLIFLSARNQNRFFSSVVRIQKDRGHVVCDQGLYHTIRHPGYLGMILSLAGIPLITVSQWCVLPTIVAIMLLIVRTTLEDKTLKAELDGYLDYSQKTKYKLLPLVW